MPRFLLLTAKRVEKMAKEKPGFATRPEVSKLERRLMDAVAEVSN
jgi:hypothetical protein